MVLFDEAHNLVRGTVRLSASMHRRGVDDPFVIDLMLPYLQESVCDSASSFDLTAADLACSLEELQAVLETVTKTGAAVEFNPSVRAVAGSVAMVNRRQLR